MEKKLRVAIIGQGRSGRDIHGAYFRSERNTHYEVVAVVDELDYRRERAAEEYGCPVYASYQELFGRDDIDLVVNSTYSYQHADISIDLLRHGFNVICEKPFAKTYEDGCRVIRQARKSGRMFNVFQQSRFAPYFTRIREILDSGILGEVIQVSIDFSSFGRRWDWQTSLDYAGGNVRNTGPHPLDQAMTIMGYPEDCNVFSKLGCVNTFGDAEDYAKIILTAPGKPLVDVEISSCNAYPSHTYVISCKNGSLRASMKTIEYKYFDPQKAPEQKQILESLRYDDGSPRYCGETLPWVECSEDLTGSAFDVGTQKYYEMIYKKLTDNTPMEIVPEQLLCQLRVIDLIHAQNPLALKED